MLDGLNDDEWMALTRAIMELLDEWGLGGAEQVSLLDLPGRAGGRMLRRYREDTPLPNTPEVKRRVQYLLRIADALRTTYPRNSRMGTRWIKQRNRRLHNRIPLKMMVERGEHGMALVLAQLDCVYAWDESGSKAAPYTTMSRVV